jgi:tetratricopeptide (TPR) repeat protein
MERMLRAVAPLILVGLLIAPPTAALAQQHGLPLKRQAPAARPMTCDDVPEPATAAPTPEERVEAQRLAGDGDQAALLGDLQTAVDDLTRAEKLDPSVATTAYHLARVFERLQRNGDAVAAYCHFLALGPATADTIGVRNHLLAIAPSEPGLSPDAMEAFQRGLQSYDAGRFNDAVAAFSDVITRDPQWPTAYYDRALAQQAAGQSTLAAGDLQSYLERAGTAATDSVAIGQVLAQLRSPHPRYNPRLAFVAGLFVPGLGQVYTNRAGFGLIIAAAAGGAVALALQKQVGASVSPDKPYLAPGIGAAVAVSLLGAIEASVFASRSARPPLGSASDSAAKDGPRLHLLQPASAGGLSLLELTLP